MTNVVSLSGSAERLLPGMAGRGMAQNSLSAPTVTRVGASGRRYELSSFDLLSCPDLHAGVFVLTSSDGTATAIGALNASEPSENLATVRRCAARLGATAVHVRAIDNPQARSTAIWDLQSQAFGRVATDVATAELSQQRRVRLTTAR
ncbi:MAG: hypothetical protein AAGJ70_11265 [Pseudomonadota bacterium]